MTIFIKNMSSMNMMTDSLSLYNLIKVAEEDPSTYKQNPVVVLKQSHGKY